MIYGNLCNYIRLIASHFYNKQQGLTYSEINFRYCQKSTLGIFNLLIEMYFISSNKVSNKVDNKVSQFQLLLNRQYKHGTATPVVIHPG